MNNWVFRRPWDYRPPPVFPFSLGTLNQTVSPDGIASGEAFGTLQANLTIFPSAFGSDEAFGTLQVNLTIFPTALASGEAFGTPQVNLTIFPAGLASSEAFGTASVSLVIYPTGLGSSEAFGTLQANLTIYPAGLATGEAFGTAVVGGVSHGPGDIASGEAFGTPQVNLKIYPQGIWTSEAFGTVTIGQPQTVSPTGIATGEAFGVVDVTGGITTVTPTPIPSAEAFGTPTAAHVQTASIDSGEAFGNLTISITVPVASIGSEEAFGTPTVRSCICPVGIASAEAFGTCTVTAFGFVAAGDQTVFPAGIPSAGGVGTPTVREPFPTSNRRPSFISYPPDWRRPVTVSAGWDTLLVRNREGGEQRQRLRKLARYSIGYTSSALNLLEFARRRYKAITDTGLPVVVPLWTEWIPLLEVADATHLTVDGFPTTRFKVGSWVYVNDGTLAVFKRVTHIDVATFTFGSAPNDTDPIGFDLGTIGGVARVYPCVLGMLKGGAFRFSSTHPESQDQLVEVEEL